MGHVVIIRHAHRDLGDRDLDNGLDAKGWQQMQTQVKQIKALGAEFPVAKKAFSSPKLRCRETLEYLTDFWGTRYEVEELLNEQKPGESHLEFAKRMDQLLAWLKGLEAQQSPRDPGPWILCSHGDVIPELCQRMGLGPVELKKGALIEVKWGKVIRELRP